MLQWATQWGCEAQLCKSQWLRCGCFGGQTTHRDLLFKLLVGILQLLHAVDVDLWTERGQRTW